MPVIVLIGGGTASGKTYVTDQVMKRLGTDRITHMSLDDYYKDQTSIPLADRTRINYDHPKAFDWKLMETQLLDLKAGKAIKKPIYDFKIHNRSGSFETIVPKELVMVEGIMALVNARIRRIGNLKVFVNASRERRFLRRLERDQKERGRSRESVISQYFGSVLPMYEEVIQPSSIYADLIINNDDEISTLAIEVLTAVLKDFLDNKELVAKCNGTGAPTGSSSNVK